MIRLPWKRHEHDPPKPSPEIARAVNRLAVETARVAEQLERATNQREGNRA